jgi:glyoxylase-like metal-dependent hydrolase (beta-lactamase superfamily II)
LYDGTYASNSYLLTDEEGSGAVLVDPSVPPAVAERLYGPLPRIDTILLTHGHFDHMLALDAWRERTGAPLWMSAYDAPALLDPAVSCYRTFLHLETVHAPADRLIAAGDLIPVGREALTVLETPGHTPGCLCFDDGCLLLTGDTLFADGGYGRFDLPTGNAAILRTSLSRIVSLEGERRIYAGHGPATLLTEEKKHFNFL